MIGGHSDITLGFPRRHRPGTAAGVTQIVSTWGLAANPFDCWQADRGLQTSTCGCGAATCERGSARRLAGGSAGCRSGVPGPAGPPGLYAGGAAVPGGLRNMLCFELAGGRDA